MYLFICNEIYVLFFLEPGRPNLPRVVPYDANAVNITYKLPGYGGLPASFTVYYKHKGCYFKDFFIISIHVNPYGYDTMKCK